MARIPRLLVKGEDTVYHIISRTALPGYVLGDVEKDYLLSLIKDLSSIFFVDVFGFCIMGNHFHESVLVSDLENRIYLLIFLTLRFGVHKGTPLKLL